MAKSILIIDDKGLEREELKEILGKDHEILEARDGRAGMLMMREHLQELKAVYLRLELDGISGADILRKVSEKGITGRIPFLIIEGEEESETAEEWFDLGAVGFERRPFSSKMVRRQLQLAVKLCGRRKTFPMPKNTFGNVPDTMEELLQQRNGLMEVIGNIVEFRNMEFSGHVHYVAEYTRILGMQVARDYPDLKLSAETVEKYAAMSMLHDVGKFAVPDHIMNKPGRLTAEEYELVQSHTTKGWELISRMGAVFGKDLDLVLDIVRSHHERYDGGGYPDGLKGDAIPLSAQLVSLADAYDDLVSERSDKKAVDKEEVFRRITEGDEGVFNPRILDSFRRCKEKFEKLADRKGFVLN